MLLGLVVGVGLRGLLVWVGVRKVSSDGVGINYMGSQETPRFLFIFMEYVVGVSSGGRA